jgi:hypothetical protein
LKANYFSYDVTKGRSQEPKTKWPQRHWVRHSGENVLSSRVSILEKVGVSFFKEVLVKFSVVLLESWNFRS